MPNTKFKTGLSLLFALLFLAGCGTWENFTTYFNVYYNASRLYDEAEEEIIKSETNIFELKHETIPQQASKSLTDVIEKCSKILQFSSESAYFDNALFMIGKSYYYQGNYSKSLRKFLELEAVEENDLLIESKLWIGRSHMQLREFDLGLEKLREARELALREEREELVIETYKSEVALYIDREDYESAIAGALEMLDYAEDDEIKADITYELGRLYLTVNDMENAAKYFQLTQEYDPTFDTEFASKLEYGKIQRDLGNTDEAMEIFEDLRDEDKYQDFWHEVDLAIGLIYKERGDYEEALDQLRYVDTTYAKTQSAGYASYNMAEILNYHYEEFDSAANYYARTMEFLIDTDTRLDAGRKLKTLDRFVDVRSELYANLKQLDYVMYPEIFTRDSLEYENTMAQYDSLLITDDIGETNRLSSEDPITTDDGEEENILDDDQETLAAGNSPKAEARDRRENNVDQDIPDIPKPTMPDKSEDELRLLVQRNMFDLANIFFTEMESLDSAKFYYENILEEYGDSAYAPKALYALGTYHLSLDNEAKADSMFKLVYDEYPDDPLAVEAGRQLGYIEEVESDPMQELYLQAEDSLYADKYDKAIELFYSLTEEDPESQYAPKALYTAGWVLENKLDMVDSAAAVYDTLYTRYRSTEYSQQISKKLFVYHEEQKRLEAEAQKAAEEAEQAELNEEGINEDEQGSEEVISETADSDTTNQDGQKTTIDEESNEPLKTKKKIIEEEDEAPPKKKIIDEKADDTPPKPKVVDEEAENVPVETQKIDEAEEVPAKTQRLEEADTLEETRDIPDTTTPDTPAKIEEEPDSLVN